MFFTLSARAVGAPKSPVANSDSADTEGGDGGGNGSTGEWVWEKEGLLMVLRLPTMVRLYKYKIKS